MNRGRVGEERGGKEMDRCPLTLLPTDKFQYNNTVHSSTQQTLFMVDTRRHTRMGF
jgi:hypothetical protein